MDRVRVEGELSSCPKCGGGGGFHVGLRRPAPERRLDVFLLCPACRFRFTVGEFLIPDGEPRPFDPTLDGGQ